MLKTRKIQCDLCVIGGGMSGIAAAISAAREGLNVVLMHERPVLGGNASSEIRMWICGAHGRNNRETGILEEISLENYYCNPTKSFAVWDSVLYSFVRREKNITLLLNCTCMDASVEHTELAHGRNTRITSVTGYQMTTQQFICVKSKFYSDCSGDSILAPLTGAEFRVGRESKHEFNEDTQLEQGDNMTMGMSCLIQGRETEKPIKYIPPEWSTKLSEKDFENRNPDIYRSSENFWYLELGGNKNTIDDTEKLRDELLPLAVGTWDYIKNSGEFNAENWDLDFLGFLPGKRESRRMCGEYMITQRDIFDGTVFEDEIAYGGWPIDDHFPGGFYHKGVPNTDLHTPAPYSIPYRALYSKNVENLFFAGRNISMTHMAMSSIRVMATCMLLGEAVGKAATLSVKNALTPHEVYLYKIDELQSMLLTGDCFLPSRLRRISDVCTKARLIGADQRIRNGQDRANTVYGTDESTAYSVIQNGSKISYQLEPTTVKSVHVVFDSDLNRDTLPGTLCERTHTTRSNSRLSDEQMKVPLTLCKEFTVIGKLGKQEYVIIHERNNLKRSYDIKIDRQLDELTLIPQSNWGETDATTVISFDFDA